MESPYQNPRWLLKWLTSNYHLAGIFSMRKILTGFIIIISLTLSHAASALLSMELTQGVAGAIPIAVVPFANDGSVPQPIATVIADDLKNSGRFKVFGKGALSQFPTDVKKVSAKYFRNLGTDNVVIGQVKPLSGGKYQVNFELLDMYKTSGASPVTLTQTYKVSAKELRAVAHHISDLIYEKITGVRGVFATRIAYIVVQGSQEGRKRYILEVSDMDGYNPRPLLNSPQPVMSPSWSPDGKKIAYVSFENRHAGIYIHDVITGKRELVSEFPGINGAPAWSPDGSKLALVLSKQSSPNIYVLDLRTKKLTQLTDDFYINTEPTWSPDGSYLLFTSNRSGGPQIYQLNPKTRAVSRVTYDGGYNARASFTPDGKNIAVIHKVSGIFKIGMLGLDDGRMRVLTTSAGDSASPSVAPNGSMVLYDTRVAGQNMLGMVSADGRVQILLPARNGNAQDPAWSPFRLS